MGRFRRPAEHPSGRRLRAGRRIGPSPYALGQHDALVAADLRLQPGDSACVTFSASLMTEIPKSLPPNASRFCRPASADSDSNVRGASLLPHTGLRGPTLCPSCGCVAAKLLRVAWPNSKPDHALCLRAAAAAGAHLTHAGWEGPRLFNPFSRHRVAAGPCAARAGAVAFAVWAACCHLARHRPQQGRHNTARPHAHRFAAAAAAAARQMRGPLTRLRRRCRCLR